MPARYITYDAFGNTAAETDVAISHLFGYTGREFDKGTGLQYNRERYYDPKLGRFISQDPMSFAAGDANLYRYVGNHGTYANDPSGLEERHGTQTHQVDEDGIVRKIGGVNIYPVQLSKMDNVMLQMAIQNNESVTSSGDGIYTIHYRDGRQVLTKGPASQSATAEAVRREAAGAILAEAFVAVTPPVEKIPEPVRVRLYAVPQAAGGALEMIGGTAGIAAPTVITQVIGGVAFAHGADNFGTGGYIIIYGVPARTQTSQSIEAFAGSFTDDKVLARYIGDGGDIAAGFIIPGAQFSNARRLALTPEFVLSEEGSKWLNSTSGRYILPGTRAGEGLMSVDELVSYHDHFGHTWASGDGIMTVSAHGNLAEEPINLVRLSQGDVEAVFGKFSAHLYDRGSPGKYHALHAEPQLLASRPNLLVGNVGLKPCSQSCDTQFLPKFATERGIPIMFGSPKGVSVYRPGDAKGLLIPNTTIPPGALIEIPQFPVYLIIPGVGEGITTLGSAKN